MADTATYIGSDALTSGSWKGVYGFRGFQIIGNVSDYPDFVTATPTGNTGYTWGATDAQRALELANSNNPEDRIAACWYSNASFTIRLQFSDANVHRVEVYFLDWDRLGRAGRVDVLDSLGAVLDTRNVSNYGDGLYLIWDLTGDVTFRFTSTSHFTVSGIFFDGGSNTAGAGLTEENVFVGKQVDNTQSITSEHVHWANRPENEQRVSTEHVIVNNWPPNTQRFTQAFVVVALHEAPPPTMAQLTVNKTVSPTSDPGKFNLLIDGRAEAVDVGNGGTTGAITLDPGAHVVSEGAGTGTDLADYDTVISGDAAADGSIALAAGESKTVSITNTRKAAPPEPPAPPTPPSSSGCPPAFTLRRIAITLRRAKLPVRGADQ